MIAYEIGTILFAGSDIDLLRLEEAMANQMAYRASIGAEGP